MVSINFPSSLTCHHFKISSSLVLHCKGFIKFFITLFISLLLPICLFIMTMFFFNFLNMFKIGALKPKSTHSNISDLLSINHSFSWLWNTSFSFYKCLSSVQFSSVQSLSRVQLFVTHESQHARPPCPSPFPGVHSNSRPSSQ